jgi:hypothetical protein
MSACISCHYGEAVVLDSEGEGLCRGCWEIYREDAIAAAVRSTETRSRLGPQGRQSGHRPNDIVND